MNTFSEEDAGMAFSAMARMRFSNPDSGVKPTDVALFAWLVAEAARVNCNPFSVTTSDIFSGFEVVADGQRVQIASVGLSLNTVKTSMDRLEELGYISIDRTPATKGYRLTVEIVSQGA
jgi:hypothetical protein